MLSKNEIERIYNKIAESVDISEQYFDQATLEYQNMAKWLVKNTPQYEIEIYPQGSFALGTVVQPFDREDEYDLDLVCEYKKDYGFSAKELKTRKVQSIIDQYGRIKTKKEKKRCWQVTYEHNSHFHIIGENANCIYILTLGIVKYQKFQLSGFKECIMI